LASPAQRQFELESEPSFKDDSEVIEWGGELYWAVDYTSSGAPIGLRLSELREMEARESNAGWARAKRVLDCVFNECGEVEIGRVVKVGQGLSHQVFAANVELQNDPNALSGDYAVRLPLGTNATTQEARLVLRERVLHERTICKHRAVDHLPPDEPSVLIHGDLLGQNILLSPDEHPAVIDWEYAMLGDPAFDLAIVTRASKKPFAIDRGLERLLDAYATFGPWRIAAHDVHFYELCLLARWYRDELDGNGPGESIESQWGRMRNALARARRASDNGNLGRV
jgi:Phosphotransferase enzyme family